MNKHFLNSLFPILSFLAWVCAIVFPISLVSFLLACCGTIHIDEDAYLFWIYSTTISFSTFITAVVTYQVAKAATIYIENNKKEEK